MMHGKNFLKWAVYAAVLLLAALSQSAPHVFPRIMGQLPLVLIPFVTSVAMFEKETPGAAFGIAAGLLWDLGSGRVLGFNALFLMVIGIGVALLVQFLFRDTFVTVFFLTLGFTLLHEIVTWFFFVYMAGNNEIGYCFLHVILPTTAYTAIFAIPFYFLVRLLNRKLTVSE